MKTQNNKVSPKTPNFSKADPWNTAGRKSKVTKPNYSKGYRRDQKKEEKRRRKKEKKQNKNQIYKALGKSNEDLTKQIMGLINKMISKFTKDINVAGHSSAIL